MKKTLLGISAAAFIVIACGGGNTNENTNTTTTPPPAQDAGTTAMSTPDAAAEKPWIETQHDPFMQTCLHAWPQGYCDCAFDQFKDVFKDATAKSGQPTEEQIQTLKQKTVGACSSKLSEGDIKTLFGNECLASNTKKQAWCDCEWTALRAKLQPTDFLTPFEGPKYDDAKKAVATTCKGKLDEPTAKGEFMQGCNKGAGADHQKACECMWKKLRTKSSIEEIAVGAVDLKKAGLETCKTQ